ncbi:GntR family transcriptional regulator [Trebonia sp.]|uniref:GntR family transcriptional regulator n=1 Tax=Trebonia sp. TaxID=2767075 RepID=UPI002622AAB2|nr:GntR family transcriptional regulator [Trebonia sp.]
MQTPMYQQIAEDIRTQIDSGAIARGSQLPTELELRAKYVASRNTIRDAIKRLVGMGMVETRPGQGTFVTMSVDPFVTDLTADPRTGFGGGESAQYLSQVSEQHRLPKSSAPKVEVQVAPTAITRRLRLPAGAHVISRHQQRHIDDIPWSLQTSFYPMDFIRMGATRLMMAEDITEGTVRYLAEAIGRVQASYRDWITARSPSEVEQKFFGIGHDSIVFEIFRTAFDQQKAPIRLTVTVFPADRNQFIVNVGDPPHPRYEEEPREPPAS